jgi:hypothetical protein
MMSMNEPFRGVSALFLARKRQPVSAMSPTRWVPGISWGPCAPSGGGRITAGMAASKLCSTRCTRAQASLLGPSQVNWDQMFFRQQSPYRGGTAGGARRGDGIARLSVGNHRAARFYQNAAGTWPARSSTPRRRRAAHSRWKVAGPVRADPELPGSWPQPRAEVTHRHRAC